MSDEAGGIAVTVAVSMVFIFALAAIVIDVGNLFYERRMLQNSADAAALAVAQDCAGGDCEDYESTAEQYALDNNHRGANVEDFTVQPSDGEVTIDARTGDQDGSPSLVRNLFAGLGSDENEETLARASATAIWGESGLPDEAPLPLTASVCDLMDDPEGGTYTPDDLDSQAATFPLLADLQEQHGDNIPSGPDVISIQDSSDDDDACTIQPGFSGEDESKMPAGFGWLELDDPASECGVNITQYEEETGEFWVPGRTGNYPEGRTCLEEAFEEAPVIPVFTGFTGPPDDDRMYRLYAPAAFYIADFRVPGSSQGDPDCPGPGNSGQCIRGYFVQKLEPGGINPGPSYGVTGIELSR